MNINTEWLIYAIVIVIWAGSWLASQVTSHRRKAAQAAQAGQSGQSGQAGTSKASRGDLLEARSRAEPRDLIGEALGSSRGRDDDAGSRAGVGARPDILARVSPTPASGPGEVAPPEFGKLFRDPKAFLEDMQRYAEAQQPAPPAASPAPGPGRSSPGAGPGVTASRGGVPSARPGMPARAATGAVPRPPMRPATPVARPKAEAAAAAPGDLPAIAIGSARREAQLASRQSGAAERLGLRTAEDLRRAILLSEVLGPPLALRPDHLANGPA